MAKLARRDLLEAVELVADAWNQFAYRVKQKDGRVKGGVVEVLHNGGLSTLEDIEWYLTRWALLNKRGQGKWKRLEMLKDKEDE